MTNECTAYTYRDLLEERYRRLTARLEWKQRYDITRFQAGLFPKQIEFFRDPSKFKTAKCGRRAGKTTTAGRLLFEGLEQYVPERPDDHFVSSCFIAPTKNQAKRLMWGRLQVLAKQLDVPMRWIGTDLIGKHDNGSELWIMGADDNRDVERLRGFAYGRVIVDESQAIRADFGELVEDVIEPALGDYDGELILLGTPGAACVGYFHDADTGRFKGWSSHHWTILDNSMFPRWRGCDDWRDKAKTYLDGIRDRKGWAEDSPSFMREQLGLWVRDDSALVYRFRRDRDTYSGNLPDGFQYNYIFGVDLGFDDSFAITILACSEDLPDVWEVAGYERAGLVPSQWAEVLSDYVGQYKPQKIMVDTGGLGKAIAVEFRQRYGIPVQPAEKRSKCDFIALCNSDFQGGRIHIRENSPLCHELELLQWDADRKKEDSAFANHRSDAFLYAWREAKHWTYTPPEPEPEPGTPEYSASVTAKIKKQRANRTNKKWWKN